MGKEWAKMPTTAVFAVNYREVVRRKKQVQYKNVLQRKTEKRGRTASTSRASLAHGQGRARLAVVVPTPADNGVVCLDAAREI